MGLLDELQNVKSAETSKWKMDFILAQLSEEDAAELREILADRTFASSDISKVLKARNLPISERAVQRYRSDNVFA